jgi:hypothetical protein
LTETTTVLPGVASAAPKGLATRIVGIIYSPRDTYADIAARPRVFGALAFTTLTLALTSFAFLSTEIGQNALLDQQLRMMDSLNVNIPDEVYQGMEDGMPRQRWFALAGVVVSVPVICAVVAGLMLAIFTAVLGGTASFKQTYAIAAHSQILLALQQLFVTPLNYARESMSSATTLAVFFPMLDETGFFARLLGWIDLFRIWWIVSLAIGIGVLYKRRTAPIAWSLLGVYAAIALVGATVLTMLAGA